MTLQANDQRRGARAGLTIVEMLVAIFIIALLAGIILPAVQKARESARRSQCQNNLRQQVTAALEHESALKHLPTAGWGGSWVGDPDRGNSIKQPGGWVYCVLPYLEQRNLRELGAGAGAPGKAAALTQLIQSPVAVFNCPTRRAAGLEPLFYSYAKQPVNADPASTAARTDYAANAGDQQRCEIAMYMGPSSLAQGDDPTFAWPDVSDHTGVCYLRSHLTLAEIRDGQSATYLLGEKYMSSTEYETGEDHGDDWSMYTGYQDDICRCAFNPPLRDAGKWNPSCRFGSAHPEIWNAAFCDGSVRAMSYEIAPVVHRALGNRRDGTALASGELGL